MCLCSLRNSAYAYNCKYSCGYCFIARTSSDRHCEFWLSQLQRPNIDFLSSTCNTTMAKYVALAACATATVAADITLDFAQPGAAYEGIGALSGGGGVTRLLLDYPPALQQDILDVLFTPNKGASLQYIKIEMGGKCNGIWLLLTCCRLQQSPPCLSQILLILQSASQLPRVCRWVPVARIFAQSVICALDYRRRHPEHRGN